MRLLIDAGPDMRQQVLRAGIGEISAVLITHTHADHIFGIDDLRSFNFTSRAAVPLYATRESMAEIQRFFHYIFVPDADYLGSKPPKLLLHEFCPEEPFQVAGFEVTPLPVVHGHMQVMGFRFGDLAYITDCSSIPDKTVELLRGVKTLVLDGLREREHPTHFNHAQALREIDRIAPEKAYLTHVTHDVLYSETNARLQQRSQGRVELAYDGLVLET